MLSLYETKHHIYKHTERNIHHCIFMYIIIHYVNNYIVIHKMMLPCTTKSTFEQMSETTNYSFLCCFFFIP